MNFIDYTRRSCPFNKMTSIVEGQTRQTSADNIVRYQHCIAHCILTLQTEMSLISLTRYHLFLYGHGFINRRLAEFSDHCLDISLARLLMDVNQLFL
jgi:hypothetical protein